MKHHMTLTLFILAAIFLILGIHNWVKEDEAENGIKPGKMYGRLMWDAGNQGPYTEFFTVETKLSNGSFRGEMKNVYLSGAQSTQRYDLKRGYIQSWMEPMIQKAPEPTIEPVKE
jgi:hypothetical protein